MSTHDHAHPHDHPPLATTAPLSNAPDAVLDPAQESLIRALRSGFRMLLLIMAVLMALYIASGLFIVQSNEQGLIVRAGQLRPSAAGTLLYAPGTHWAMPDPFDEKIRLPGGEQAQQLTIVSFLFNLREDDRAQIGVKPLTEIEPNSNTLKPGLDGAMLTGDKNLSHGLWTVEYKITDGAAFVKNVGESPKAAEPLLRRLLENAVVRSVSSRRVEEVTRTNIAKVIEDVQERLQTRLNDLHTGLKIQKVIAQTIEPKPVREAFTLADTAAADAEKEKSAAEKKKTEILNQVAGPTHEKLLELIRQYGAAQTLGGEARRQEELLAQIDTELERAGGLVAMLLQEAHTRANDIRETIGREVSEFQYYLPGYRRDPALTVMRLWTQMREEVLASRQNEVFFLPATGPIQILTNRDPQRLLQAEKDRYENKTRLPPPSSEQLPR